MTEIEITNDAMQVRDAEVLLLGSVLAGYTDLDDLFAAVEPHHFWQPAHGEVWAAMERVHRGGKQPEFVSVRLALDSTSRFDPVKLVDYAQLCHMPAQAPYYAEQVATAAGLRDIQDAGRRLQQIGSTPGDLDERREQARQAVDEATRGRGMHKARTLAQILPAVIDQAQDGQTQVLGTGWPDVDRLIGGLAPGRLVVIGARPGVGKSVMGTNLALHFASHHNHAVLLCSMEMPEQEVGQRMLAATTRVNLTALQMGLKDEKAWASIARHQTALEALPITVDDTPSQTVTSMRRAARDIQRGREDLALIVVDYLQQVQPTDTRANRVEQLGEISRGLKLLARETGACVVAMAQVNREAAKHGDGKPRMSDLRESGSIEADADQVVLLHQPDEKLPELEVIVDKNRHGPKGRAALQMQGHYASLASVVWSPNQGIA
jgi:replicative DNA helicase